MTEPISKVKWFACGHGHKLAAVAQDSNVPVDLTGHYCLVCLGRVIGYEQPGWKRFGRALGFLAFEDEDEDEYNGRIRPPLS